MTLMQYYICYFILLSISHALRFDSSCILPDGQPGTCAVVSQCQTVKDMLRFLSPQYIRILKQIYCKGTDPLQFCCQDKGTSSDDIVTSSLIQNNQNNDRQCGRITSTVDKVTGGQKIQYNSHPWLAAIGTKRGEFDFPVSCGGTLITRRHVLSAAHCFVGSGDPQDVRIGDYDLTRSDAIFQDFKILRHVEGPFDARNGVYKGDISLILLKRPAQFTDSVQPACLPPADFNLDEHVGRRLTVVGWGRNEFDFQPNIAHEAKVAVRSSQDCLSYFNVLDDTHACAGQGKQDSCNGDSGGPLLYKNNNDFKTYIVGIVSFGSHRCGVGIPGVYTKVSSWLSWINNNIQTL